MFLIKYLFGTRTIWRGNIKIKISDPHKTILDIVNDPELGGGLQHTFDCFKEYAKLFPEEKDRKTLFEYMIKLVP